jgi:O-antigen/teichoic acid export membrane protein
MYKVNGYFYALLLFNIVCSLALGAIALGPLKADIHMPSRSDFKKLLKELLSISLAIYVVKILYTFWERSGPLLLGTEVSKEMVASFALAMLYSKKLLTISDAVTDVNLPVFSDKYSKHVDEFKMLFTENFNKLFVIIMFSGIFVVYWSQNLIPLLVGGRQYNDALVLILPLTFAFMIYSFINIVHSSLFVPAKLVKEMIFVFASLLVSVGLFYFVARSRFDALSSMAYAMFFSSIVCWFTMHFISHIKLKFGFIKHDHLLILAQCLIIGFASDIQNILLKGVLFLLFVALFIWGAFIAQFISKSDLTYGIDRGFRVYRKVVKTK